MNHEFKNKIKRRLIESLLSEEMDDDGTEYSPVIFPPPFWQADPSRIWRGAQPGIPPDDILGRGFNDDYFYQLYFEMAWDEVMNHSAHEWPEWYIQFDPFYDPRTDPRWQEGWKYMPPYFPPSLRPTFPGQMKEPEEAGDEGNHQPIYGFMGRYNRPNIPDTSV